jgi:hypothetical protein
MVEALAVWTQDAGNWRRKLIVKSSSFDGALHYQISQSMLSAITNYDIKS